MFVIKQNDTSPALKYSLRPLDVDLTGASVVFNMRNEIGNTVKIARKPAIIVTAKGNPTVHYEWEAGDTDTVGTYEAEFEVTFANGRVETFPAQPYIKIRIVDDIA